MKKHTTPTTRHLRLALITIVVLVASIGLAVVITLSQQTQDTRQQASVSDRLVQITHPNISVKSDQQTTLPLLIDTKGSQITGVELHFQISGTFSSDPKLTINTASGLNPVLSSMTKNETGYQVKLIALPAPGQPIAFSQPTNFANIDLTPTSTEVSIKFDNDDSMTILYNDLTNSNQLQAISDISLAVESDQQPIVTSSPVAIATSPTTAPLPTATPIPEEYYDEESYEQESYDDGIGGDIELTCNEYCSSNSQCARNLTCFEGTCRLATNPSSEECVNPPDTGIQRSCNEYCSDNNECGDELVCWYNRCRQAENVQSTTCDIPEEDYSYLTTYDDSQKTQTYYPATSPESSLIAQAPIEESEEYQQPELSEEYSNEVLYPAEYNQEGDYEIDSLYANQDEVIYDLADSPEQLAENPNYNTTDSSTSHLPLIFGGVSIVGLLAAIAGFGAYKLYLRKKDESIISPTVEHPVTASIDQNPPASMSSFAGPTTIHRPQETPPPTLD